MTIVDQLRKAIDKSKESQAAIARATGVDRAMLNQFVRGERSVSLETAAMLCHHLGLRLAERRRPARVRR